MQTEAGSENSTLITYFTFRLNQTLGMSSLKLLAPTWAAAVNIIMVRQYTFLLKVNETFKNLNLHVLAKFRNELYGCKFIIIHKMIMLGWSLLRKFDLRLQIAFSSRQGWEPFGGLFVCSFGYINRLSSVKDRPFYSDKTGGKLNRFLLEGKL